MPYLCLDCYEVYNMNLPYCPKPSCNGHIIEVDELMLATIMLLNEKGYCTQFCCSGHIYDYASPYVLFDKFFSEILEDMKMDPEETFDNLPEPWKIENKDSYGRICLRCNIERSKNVAKLQKDICNANMKLLSYVKKLPSLFDE